MRLLADESLAGRTRHFLRTLGHELLTLEGLGRLGATNGLEARIKMGEDLLAGGLIEVAALRQFLSRPMEEGYDRLAGGFIFPVIVFMKFFHDCL